jgi:riboflavin kinase / FMN adenylyltransferase
MKREYGLERVGRHDASVVTVGTFDGMHVGHQAIIRYLLGRARDRDGVSVVVTFDPHPREVVYGEAVPLLTTVEERADVLEAMGVDRFIVLPFTEAFAGLPAHAFVQSVLVDRIGLREIVIGYDHGFGRDRTGDRVLLEEMGTRLGFTVDTIPAQLVDHAVVSSTAIRRLLVDEGDVARAAQMLGRPYRLDATVVPGDGRGRTIGYPTANLQVSHARKVIPKAGVYAVAVSVTGSERAYGGMMNIGVRPTFGGGELRAEVHLFDFEGDLYGASVRVEMVERVRDERRFESVDALREQLSKDRLRCTEAIEGVYSQAWRKSRSEG